MTRATLLRSVLSVMAFLAALLALAIYAQAQARTDAPGNAAAPLWVALHDAIKDFTGLFIAIPGAWLAYCFSRRSAFLSILDELWRDMVKAKGLCLAYGHDPSAERLEAARTALSDVIDNMRSVYRNVGECDTRVGLFPFEPLHDMRRTLDAYAQAVAGASPAQRAELQPQFATALIGSWHALRHSFLKEFGAPAPTHPIVERNARDPRRPRLDPKPPSAPPEQPQASSSTSQ